MDKIGIVLINYKDYAEKFIEECRDTLRTQTFPIEQTTVYIIDNAGNDETMNYLHQICPEAKVYLRPDGNYSAGNNLGIKKALEDGCDYVVITNMDTRFDKDWLLELYTAAKIRPDAGMIQSKVLLYPADLSKPEEFKINTVGNFIQYLGFGFTDGYNLLNSEYKNTDIAEIKGYCSGCSQIISREVLERIGSYNEEYYMYHDDIEMGWRAKLAGYKLYLAPKSIIFHKYEFGRSVRMLYYMERNRFIAILSFYKIRTLLLLLPIMLFMEAGMWAYALLGGWIGTKFRVFLYFLRLDSWRKIWQTRVAIQSTRRLKDKDILKTMNPTIEFQEIANFALKHIANPIITAYYYLILKLIIW